MANAAGTEMPPPKRPRWSDREHRMVYGWIPNGAYDAFVRAATARGEHVDALVARTLTIIATDKLLGAILDERDGD